MAFEAKIICDCPYGYSYPFEKVYQVNGSVSEVFYNDSSCAERLKPEMVINLAPGCTNFSIKNETTGQDM